MDLAGRSMKAQMRAADRAGASLVIIRGDSEMEKGTFVLKDMAAGSGGGRELDLRLQRPGWPALGNSR
jgi:histidyl-tRNA synthetase